MRCLSLRLSALQEGELPARPLLDGGSIDPYRGLGAAWRSRMFGSLRAPGGRLSSAFDFTRREIQMPIDEKLANRVRRCVAKRSGLSERSMFGCLGFFLHGNLACGIHEDELIVRVDPDSVERLLKEPHTRPFDLSGRPLKGWLLVKVADTAALSRWVERGITYAATLPRK